MYTLLISLYIGGTPHRSTHPCVVLRPKKPVCANLPSIGTSSYVCLKGTPHCRQAFHLCKHQHRQIFSQHFSTEAKRHGRKTWNLAPSAGFESVYVANAEYDTARSINAKLQAGLHVVMAPGVYNLEASLRLVQNGQVLLRIGMATLIPTNGNAVVTVGGNVTGARVSGLLLQAGTTASSALLQWGGNTDGAARTTAATRTATRNPRTSAATMSSGAAADSEFGFIHDVCAAG